MRVGSRRRLAAVGGVVVALGGLAGCGSGSSGGSTTPGASTSTSGTPAASASAVAKDDALAAKLPADLAAKGTLLVGTDSSYAPSEFLDADGKTVIGFDVDLAKAIGTVLGLKVTMSRGDFGTLVEGVKSGKFDAGMSSFTINPERLQQVDMVSYFAAGTSWAAGATGTGITPETACGKKIAVQKDTTQVPDITKRSKACTDAGKPAIQIEQYTLQSDATSAVVTGKDDALLADSPVVADAVKKTGGKLTPIGETYDSAPYGVVLPKGKGTLAQAVQGAVQKLIDSGVYLQILKTWGVEGGAVTTSELNPTVK